MLHLSPESGKWLPCSVRDEGKCELLYHAPVEEGEIVKSLLWETYASEELSREPSMTDPLRAIWHNADGHYHREYGLPAIETVAGGKEWWVNGKRHRVSRPAVEGADGTKEWWQNDELHRLDGPAVEAADGAKQWWVNGVLHRIDGPAVEPAREWADGLKEWYQNGKLHRTDGPAVEGADGIKNGATQWWVNGVKVELGSTV